MDEEYFKAFFSSIASVACDKAKELVEKKKDAGDTALQSLLVQLSQCEKSYYSLAFMEQKWFGRKNPLKSAYQAMSSDFQVLLKQSLNASGEPEGAARPSLMNEVIEALSNFCLCRFECIELYESTTSSFQLEELGKSSGALIQKYEPKLQSSVIKPLLDSFLSEFNTFRRLTDASVLIGEWNFFTSLMGLHKIHQTLKLWQPLLAKDQHHTYSFRSGIFGFGEKRSTSPVSAVYQWMEKYFKFLVSKFSFYFYAQLSQQSKGDEIKGFLAKTSYDFAAKCHAFCKKLDTCHVLLGAIGNENTTKLIDQGQKETHAKLLELPTPMPVYIWPYIDVFLYNKSEEITMEKVVFFYEKSIDFSFFAAQSDPGITLVIAVAGKKTEKDSYIVNYVIETVAHLRTKRIFLLLRPGAK